MTEWEDLWLKRRQRVGYAFVQRNEAGLNLWLDHVQAEGDKIIEELRDTRNRFGWLLDTMSVDYDDLFEEYDEDDL